MQGTRLPDGDQTDRWPPPLGGYWREGGHWHAMTPNGMLANLRAHDVVEHADGTITVSPSILVTQAHKSERWHGYLVAGVWKEC